MSLLLLVLLACHPDPPKSETGRLADTGQCASPPWSSTAAGEALEPWPGNGVSEEESASARLVVDALLADPWVAMVAWREEGTARYHLAVAGTEATFVAERSEAGIHQYAWESPSPLLDEPMGMATLAQELEAGSNPMGTTLTDQGYLEDDPRLSFIETAQASFPDQAVRLAQLFDHPDSPDLAYAVAPFANGGVGTHGGFSVAQTRAPLLLRGPGVVAGTHDLAVQSVDIAPTVAALLGVQPVEGVDGREGVQREGLMLKWQDGRVLEEILTGDCAWGAADHALLVIFDGLSHTELWDGIDSGRLPRLQGLAAGGARVAGGAMVGFPSLSLPGHTTVVTGAWQGHHGYLSNGWVDAETGASAPGVDMYDLAGNADAANAVADTWLSPEVETLFEAVARSGLDGETASINDLVFRGATWSRLAESPVRDPGGPVHPSTLATSLVDDTAVLQARYLFEEAGPPRLMTVAFYVTDDGGEESGPHGDGLRTVLGESDARLGTLLDLYDAAGVLDSTLVVITADHGMELQDPARTASPSAAIAASGVAATVTPGGLIYLSTSAP